MNSLRYVYWLEDGGKSEQQEVRGRTGVEVQEGPEAVLTGTGFWVGSQAYLEFLSSNGLFPDIRGLLTGFSVESAADLWARSAAIRQLIMRTALPEHVRREIATSYEELASPTGGLNPVVTVHGTVVVTAAGQAVERLIEQCDPYMDVSGSEQVVQHVQRCWARLWVPRAIYCREELGCHHLDALPKVLVERVLAQEAAIA